MNIHNNTTRSFVGTVLRDAYVAIPVAIFLIIQLFPTQVLAFSNQHNTTQQALKFSFDHAVIINTVPISLLFEPGTILGVVANAYNSVPEQTDASPFITASGTRTRPGVIAANFLPLGTKIRIQNTMYTVEDRMNQRYNNTYHIDIWMESIAAARTFGTRSLIIEIVSLPEK